ncbi:MAG: glycine cleavage system protein GcvH [Candidatus Eremiobacterota bacterium]
MKVLANLLYTKDHEWARIEGSVVTTGITDYAQDQLGDIVYVELPSEGTEISQFSSCGAIDSVKASSEIYAPVSGKVIEVNSAVADNPSLLNSSPYEEGWLIKIEISSEEELSGLLKAAEYEEIIKGA